MEPLAYLKFPLSLTNNDVRWNYPAIYPGMHKPQALWLWRHDGLSTARWDATYNVIDQSNEKQNQWNTWKWTENRTENWESLPPCFCSKQSSTWSSVAVCMVKLKFFYEIFIHLPPSVVVDWRIPAWRRALAVRLSTPSNAAPFFDGPPVSADYLAPGHSARQPPRSVPACHGMARRRRCPAAKIRPPKAAASLLRESFAAGVGRSVDVWDKIPVQCRDCPGKVVRDVEAGRHCFRSETVSACFGCRFVRLVEALGRIAAEDWPLIGIGWGWWIVAAIVCCCCCCCISWCWCSWWVSWVCWNCCPLLKDFWSAGLFCWAGSCAGSTGAGTLAPRSVSNAGAELKLCRIK